MGNVNNDITKCLFLGIFSQGLYFILKSFCMIFMTTKTWQKQTTESLSHYNFLYLFLDTVELHHLDDEWCSAPFVLNGPQQSPYVVHAEGLWPAPVPPSLDADVQQLQDGTEQDTHIQTPNRDRRHQTSEVRFIALYLSPSKKASKQQASLFRRFWWWWWWGGQQSSCLLVLNRPAAMEVENEGRTQ